MNRLDMQLSTPFLPLFLQFEYELSICCQPIQNGGRNWDAAPNKSIRTATTCLSACGNNNAKVNGNVIEQSNGNPRLQPGKRL